MKEADILVAVKALWDANGTLTTLVPGGLHEGRVPQDRRAPYASVKLVEGEIERNSAPWYLQHFELTLLAWNLPGAGAVDAGAIKRAVRLTLNEERPEDLVVDDASTIHVRYQPGDLTEDPAVKESQDVYLAGMRWDILLRVNRR